MRLRLLVAGIGIAACCTSDVAIVSGQQLTLTPFTCSPTIASIGSCPNDGCGGLSDALLNRAKNRTDSPSEAPPVMHAHEIADIEEPADWLTGQARDSVADTEGKPVRLMAFLKIVKTETSGETCNCNLHSLADTDLHLVMVDHKNDVEADSVTAEITPRVRQMSHPSWSGTKIAGFNGRFVRLTGWLMFDSAHAHHSHKANNDDRDHAGSPLKRMTNWEVHPVTKFEICTQMLAKCRQGIGWQDVP